MDMHHPDPRWQPTLPDARALAAYIDTWSSGFVDTERIEENYFGAGARLELVPIDQIKPGPDEVNVPNAKKEARYAKLPLETMPPLVIENGIVEDGHHRLRVAKAKGATAVWCYVVVDEAELGASPVRRPAP
jgi:hypothetical protein